MILVSDFDNTLYVKKQLHQNIKQIKKWQALGNKFIIATGRSYTGIKQLLVQHDISYDFLICNDGAVIYDSDDNIIKYYYIKNDITGIMNILKSYNYNSHIDKVEDKCIRIYTIFSNKNKALEIVDTIKYNYSFVWLYLSKKTINILPLGINKKVALDYISDKYNYDKKEIYSIGDSVNDLELIESYNGKFIKNRLFSNKNTIRSLHKYIKELMKN